LDTLGIKAFGFTAFLMEDFLTTAFGALVLTVFFALGLGFGFGATFTFGLAFAFAFFFAFAMPPPNSTQWCSTCRSTSKAAGVQTDRNPGNQCGSQKSQAI
jgi:hypothetical protein